MSRTRARRAARGRRARLARSPAASAMTCSGRRSVERDAAVARRGHRGGRRVRVARRGAPDTVATPAMPANRAQASFQRVSVVTGAPRRFRTLVVNVCVKRTPPGIDPFRGIVRLDVRHGRETCAGLDIARRGLGVSAFRRGRFWATRSPAERVRAHAVAVRTDEPTHESRARRKRSASAPRARSQEMRSAERHGTVRLTRTSRFVDSRSC